jgi:hypothetical protein
LAVGELGDRVEEGRELYDLAVCAARDIWRFFEARALELPNQFDAVGKLRFFRRLAVGGRSLVGDGEDFGLLFFCGRDCRFPLDT